MFTRLASSRGWAFAFLAFLSAFAHPVWAACNGNPKAKIDPLAQTVPERTGGNATTVTLDGSKSTPGNNDLLYQWSYLGSTPTGLAVTLSSATAQKPTFAAPSVGPAGAALNFQLTVTCGTQTDTTTTVINVTDVFVNAAPIASGFISPLNATEGQTVTLDGTGSSDPDNQPITYAWTQISGSPTVTLGGAGAVRTFVAPNLSATTTLGFRLTVSDGTLSSFVDKTVSIVFTNDPPIAVLGCPAGGVLNVNEGQSVTFNASGSSDPEGGALSWAWSQNAGLPNLGIGGLTTSSITFFAPHLGYQQLGGMTVTTTVTDPLLASASKSCGLFIRDVTAPVIVVPNDITAEATSAAGANVPYSVTSQDAVEDQVPRPLACAPASNSVFALDANTTVNCTDHDANNNTANASFKILVHDTTPPVLTVPGAFGVEATSAQGAIANWVASALDLVDGIIGPDCTYHSGDQFPLGDTTVTCNATDAHHNKSADKSFIVTVHDTQGPVIAPHGDVVAEATKPQGADVAYTSPSWHDAVDGDGTATCLPASGSTFALGTTPVHCSAKDSAGNESTSSFNVQVKDTTPPALTLPDDITQEATGPAGAIATFAPTASDLVSGSVPVTCIPASGSTFNLAAAPTKAKATQVDCTATDAAGNPGTGHFNVTVQDTTAPVLSVPDDFKVEATSAQGAIATYLATSLDLVDGIIGPDCNHPSGEQFPLDTTTVTCSVTDTRGNQSGSQSFHITVQDTTPPAIDPHADITGVEATSPDGASVAYTSPKWTDAVDGQGTANCLPASGSTFALGTSTVQCSAQDAAGNSSTSSFTIE
ncbi:MAG TPA: HYR domain-containing protein, partial [Lysobacter sp.]|nr:HYR domain-containing protein [Lysobacter sp.]